MALKLETRGAVPQSFDEADALLAQYGETSTRIVRLEANLAEALAKVKATYQQLAKPHQERLSAIFEDLETYAAANRKALTDGGKVKQVKMPAGVIGWRLCPPSVKYKSRVKAEDVIAEIRGLRLPRFLRRVWEVNKQAILADREAAAKLKTVRIVEDVEEFYIDPTAGELAEPRK